MDDVPRHPVDRLPKTNRQPCNRRPNRYIPNLKCDDSQLIIQNGVIIAKHESIGDSFLVKTVSSALSERVLGVLLRRDFLTNTVTMPADVQFQDVELSASQRHLAVVAEITMSKGTVIDRVIYMLVIVDVCCWEVKYKYPYASWIKPAIAFCPGHQEALTVFHMACKERSAVLEVHDLHTGDFIFKNVNSSSIDSDSESGAKITYTRDGRSIVLLLMEKIWYSAEFLCRIFVLSARISSQDLVTRQYTPFLSKTCHDACMNNITPTMSRCGGKVIVMDANGGHKEFHLPRQLSLKHACRVTVLSQLVQQESDIDHLQIPSILKQFLKFH